MSVPKKWPERFKVVYNNDNLWGTYSAMLDSQDGGVEVGRDGGEPEDQSFGRDWAWVPALCNELDAQLKDKDAELAEAKAELADWKSEVSKLLAQMHEHGGGEPFNDTSRFITREWEHELSHVVMRVGGARNERKRG